MHACEIERARTRSAIVITPSRECVREQTKCESVFPSSVLYLKLFTLGVPIIRIVEVLCCCCPVDVGTLPNHVNSWCFLSPYFSYIFISGLELNIPFDIYLRNFLTVV